MATTLTRVRLDDRDPRLSYGGGWLHAGRSEPNGDFNSTTTVTTYAGATVTLRFNGKIPQWFWGTNHVQNYLGTSVAVYGALPPRNKLNVTLPFPQSSYVLDDDPSTYFVFSPMLVQDAQRQALFFMNSTLTPSDHTLVITSLCPNAQFYLDFIEFTSLESITSPSASMPSPSISSPAAYSSRTLKWAAIAGAVLGTVAVTVLAAIYLFRAFKKRRQQSRKDTVIPTEITAYGEIRPLVVVTRTYHDLRIISELSEYRPSILPHPRKFFYESISPDTHSQ